MDIKDRLLAASAAKPSLAYVCLGLGVVGLVLPLIPGIPLLIIGGLLLRRQNARATPSTPRRAGLSGAQRLQLQFWLLARRITTIAESIRVSRARRVHQREI